MRIWIDLANSPQVLFFRPLIAELNARGNEVSLTTRAYAQTIPLADQFGFQHTPIGEHGGRGMLGLIGQNFRRALALSSWARDRKFDLAVSHNAYSQIVAARLLRIPVVTLMDYEHQPLNHLGFRLARKVIVPEVFPKKMLGKYGSTGKTANYPGVKEQVYLSDFKPAPNFRVKEGFPSEALLVVIRPPATWTAYHRFENELFDQLLAHLSQRAGIYNLFLPRIPSQAESVRQIPQIHLAEKVYNGPNLLYHADVVVSGGGTMNREAAVLGTPTYTVFQGKVAAVDQYLISKNRMRQIKIPADFSKIEIVRGFNRKPLLANPNLVPQLVDLILNP